MVEVSGLCYFCLSHDTYGRESKTLLRGRLFAGELLLMEGDVIVVVVRGLGDRGARGIAGNSRSIRSVFLFISLHVWSTKDIAEGKTLRRRNTIRRTIVVD